MDGSRRSRWRDLRLLVVPAGVVDDEQLAALRGAAQGAVREPGGQLVRLGGGERALARAALRAVRREAVRVLERVAAVVVARLEDVLLVQVALRAPLGLDLQAPRPGLRDAAARPVDDAACVVDLVVVTETPAVAQLV